VRALQRTRGQDGGARATLSRRMIEEALRACEGLPPDQAGRLVALLRRFEVEAARDEARRAANELADEAALELVMRHAPEALAGTDGRRPALAAA
jgi:predicted ABC-type transport system involved in lysophospholipase L1 biosynthesis ATPase subunit